VKAEIDIRHGDVTIDVMGFPKVIATN